MHPVFTQAIYYGITMLLTLIVIGFLLKGFFFKYIKVRLSFGRLILAKIKTAHRDYYKVAWFEDGFLKFKDKKEGKKYVNRISLETSGEQPNSFFYRTLGILMIDIDEKKNAPLKPWNLEAVDGYDPVSFDSLLTRAIKAPDENDNMEKIKVILLIIALVGIGVCIWLIFQQGDKITAIQNVCQAAKSATEALKPVPANIV